MVSTGIVKKTCALVLSSLMFFLFIFVNRGAVYSTQLASGISKNFTDDFILDEDSIRRIAGIFEKFSRDLKEKTKIVYYVEREDDRFYRTINIDDVLSDANIQGKKVVQFNISLNYDDKDRIFQPWEQDWIAYVDFSKNPTNLIRWRTTEKVTFRIHSENKNWALLFADEIQPQIERTFKCKKVSNRLLIFLYCSLYFLAVIVLKANEKNITKDILSFFMFIITISLFFLVVQTIGDRASFISYLFGPESFFLWGDSVDVFDSREAFRANIFLGVIVSLIVSLSANIAMALLSKNKKTDKTNDSSGLSGSSAVDA